MQTKITTAFVLFFTLLVSLPCMSDSLENAAMSAVREMMKDPESARFSDVLAVTNSKQITSICGQVNAKNSYGGYAGAKSFVYYKNKAFLLLEESLPYFKSAWALAGCSGAASELEAMLEVEADFNCKVSWEMIKSLLLHKKSPDVVIRSALHAVKARAIENGALITAETEKVIIAEYKKSIERTLNGEMKVTPENKNRQRYMFLAPCKASTMNLLRQQVGL